MWRSAAAVLVLTLAAACRPAGESKEPAASPHASPPAIPAPWDDVGIPRQRLLRVSPATDAHAFYADYSGQDRAALMSEVARGLWGAGYAQACSSRDGTVIGFAKGDRRLAVMVAVEGTLKLSVFDAEAKEKILHARCFGRTIAPSPPPGPQ